MLASSLYLSDESLSHLGIVWSGGTRSRGAESWGAGTSSVSWFLYLVVMVWVLWHVPRVFSRSFRGDCLWSWDMCMLQWLCRLLDVKVTYQAMVVLSIAWLVIFCASWGALWSSVGKILSVVRWVLDPFTGRYFQLFHCEVSHHGTSVKV